MTNYEEDFVRSLAGCGNQRRHLTRSEDGQFIAHQSQLPDGKFAAHVGGGAALAIYPLVETTTRIIAFDLDNKAGALSVADMIQAAEKLKSELARRGVTAFVVTSGSGLGTHCWAVFKEPQDAALARRFGTSVLEACGMTAGMGGVASGDVELFPKQSRETEKGGNAIALPLGRKSRLVLSGAVQDRLATPVDFEALLNADLDPNAYPAPPPRVRRRRARLEVDVAFIKSLLAATPADDYEAFVLVGMVLKALIEDEEVAYGLWADFCAKADNADPEPKLRKKWATFPDESAMGVGTLVHLAKKSGWEASVDEQVAEINLRYGVLATGNRPSVIDKQSADERAGPLSLIGTETLRARIVGEPGLLAGNKKTDAGKEWLKHPKADRYEGVMFDPSAPPGSNRKLWNLWRGYGVVPSPGDWSMFRRFLRDIIAGGDEERFNWLTNWLALSLQKPAIPVGTAIVLTGHVGIGKGFFANAIGHLWGLHYLTITDPVQAKGKFNAHMVGRRFIFIDECAFNGSRDTLGILKTRITEPTIMLERKGHDAVPMENRAVFVIASNEASVIAPDRGDRRFMMMPVSDARQEDQEYFAALGTSLEEGGYEAMLWDLLHHDYTTGPNPRRVRRSAALFDQWLRSATPYEQYVYGIANDGEIPRHVPNEPDCVLIASLWADFNSRNRMAGVVGDGALANALRDMLGATRIGQRTVSDPSVSTTRSTAWRIPPLMEARRNFQKYVGMDAPWTGGGEQWTACPTGPITA